MATSLSCVGCLALLIVVEELGVSLLLVSSSCIRVPGSIGGPMHERAERRAYHSNVCPT